VITSDFDRSNPSTYNKSTALTVYDSGGNGYLATVYYAKTQNASQDQTPPSSKWQTYFFVGDTQVKPALQQATDKVGGALFVNKYGDVLPKNDPRVVPSSGTTEMYSLDQLTDVRRSTPATAIGTALTAAGIANGSLVNAVSGNLSFDIKVDDAATAQTITYTMKAGDQDPEVLARNVEIEINNKLGALADTPDNTATTDVDEFRKNARFGITVAYDPDTARFTIASGTTGDSSSIEVAAADANAQRVMGLTGTGLKVDASASEAKRGKTSDPAVLRGETMTINTTKSISTSSSNKDFFVSVDGYAYKVELPFPTTYTNIDSFAKALQDNINGKTDPATGRKVSGVSVSFDVKAKQFVFTTGTAGENSAIQVTGSADWGLANTEMQFGATSEWKKLTQFTENGALQFVKNGVQTEDAAGLSAQTEWWPVYLDRGELSFDLTGKPISPLTGMPFETAFLAGGKGALTMSIDFTKSTQYSSAFAVLSQSQDGAPEGELMGLNIGVDGLVNATYSNGSQVSLGKIVLGNFSSPSGLRQVGDASYLASATSGVAKIGEAGSAGFGSIRAGATERANVDLTQELVDLITAQRNFQANAKAIETSSTMTSAIINIRA
jgi:flagellar hook-basal body protein